MPTFKFGQRDERLEELARQTIAKELVPAVHATWSPRQISSMNPKQTRLAYYAAALDFALTERDASRTTGTELRQDTYMLNVLAAIVVRLKGGLPIPPNHTPRAIEQGDQVRIGTGMGVFTDKVGTVVELHGTESLARVHFSSRKQHTWMPLDKLTVITDADRETEMADKQQALDDADRTIAEERANRNKATATAETSTKYRRAQDIASAAMRYRDAIQQLDLFQQEHAHTNTPHTAARRRQLRNQVEQTAQILNEYSIAEQPAPTEPDPAGKPTRAERDRMLTRMGFTDLDNITHMVINRHQITVHRRVQIGRNVTVSEELAPFPREEQGY